MAVVVSLAGTGVAVVGLLGIAAPDRLVDLLRRWRFLTSFSLTVFARIAFGIVFLAAAPHCRLPTLVRVIGVLELTGAAMLLLLGSRRLQWFVAWWTGRSPVFVRCWCGAALIFGVSLAYAGL